MNNFTVVVDACVLYPAPLRSLVMCLTLEGLFRARWTDRIHDEWIRNVIADREDITREQMERVRSLMDQHAPDALVAGYESLIDGLQLPDPDDRHVLAAAIHGRADLILTFNLKDFPSSIISSFGIEAQHPDQFLLNQLSLDESKVLTALKRQRELLKNPPKKSLEFLEILERQQLPLSVAELRRFADVI